MSQDANRRYFGIRRSCSHERSQGDEIQCLPLTVGLDELALCILFDFSESLAAGSSLS